MSLRKALPGMASTASVIFSAAASAAMPPPEMSVSEWAEANRYVAASSRPGPWRNENAPYLAEPMDCLTPSHPSKRVTLKIAAQMGKTDGAAMNWLGFIADNHPRPTLFVLPADEMVHEFNKDQWSPNYDALDGDNVFARRFEPPSTSGRPGQTAKFKPFPGAHLMLTGATSSKGLQRRSVCYLLMDEISEYPADSGGRGDPVQQARARQDAWSDEAKELAMSTPRELPDCRITKYFEAGDQRRFFVPCPFCDTYHVLKIENLVEYEGAPAFRCPACGDLIDETRKEALIRAGVYIKTYPENTENLPPPAFFPAEDLARWRARPSGGREPSFTCWQAYSLGKGWSDLLRDWNEAQENPGLMKTFSQQKLAEAWDAAGEAPDYERLYDRRRPRPVGEVPLGAYALTCAVDVQGDRLEYAVYGWGPSMTAWPVEAGVIMGDPNENAVWRELGDLRQKSFRGVNGFEFPIDLMGVDSGYLSGKVYRFCAGRPGTLALDGRGDPLMPPLSMPVHKKAADGRPAAQIYPVGTHGLKLALYHALELTAEGPDEDGVWPLGCVHLPDWLTKPYLMQMTAEALMPRELRSGAVKHEWVKIKGRANEALDLYVYARALASWVGVDSWDEAGWAKVVAERGGGPEATLESLWSGFGAPRRAAAKPLKTADAGENTDENIGESGAESGENWIETRKDWLN